MPSLHRAGLELGDTVCCLSAGRRSWGKVGGGQGVGELSRWGEGPGTVTPAVCLCGGLMGDRQHPAVREPEASRQQHGQTCNRGRPKGKGPGT